MKIGENMEPDPIHLTMNLIPQIPGLKLLTLSDCIRRVPIGLDVELVPPVQCHGRAIL